MGGTQSATCYHIDKSCGVSLTVWQEDESFKVGIVDSRQFAAVAMQIAELDESASAIKTLGCSPDAAACF